MEPDSIRWAAEWEGAAFFVGRSAEEDGGICLLVQLDPKQSITCSPSPSFTTTVSEVGEFAYGSVDNPEEWAEITDYLWVRK